MDESEEPDELPVLPELSDELVPEPSVFTGKSKVPAQLIGFFSAEGL